MTPPNTLFMGLVEAWPEPIQVGGSLWRPPWGFNPLWAWDGHRHWDLRRPDALAGLQQHLVTAGRVVVTRIPFTCADWPVPWWPVEVHERAITLGGPDAGDDLGVLYMRYQKAVGQVGFRWSPSGWPFPAGAAVPESYLRDHAVACQQSLAAIHEEQCRRTNPDLMRDLDTITIPCDRVHARLSKVGIPWSRERGAALVKELDIEIPQLQSVLEGFGITNPQDDDGVSVWIVLQGLGHLFPHGVDSDLLKDYERRHPAFGPLRRCRRLFNLRLQSWLSGCQTGPDDRQHPLHRTLVVDTGRTTTVGPALGSLPKEYRTRILTPDDPMLAYDDVDFSGYEMFVAAIIGGDEELKACCRTGKPVAALAQRIFPELVNTPVLEIPDRHPDRYSDSKAISYGANYGQGQHGLKEKLNISGRTAQNLLDRLHAICPHLHRQTLGMAYHGWRTGQLPIANGLVRYLQPDDYAQPGRIDRLAANTRIQGAAATCFRAVTVVGDAVVRQYGGEIVLPLHDGLHYVAPLAVMPVLAPAMQAAMQATFARMFNTDLVPPVSSSWLKAQAMSHSNPQQAGTLPNHR